MYDIMEQKLKGVCSMCGIAGIISFIPRERKRLSRMLSAIRHRGPDSSARLDFRELSLGYVRLSIIDPEHGNQPFESGDGSISVFYNGEIYNYRELTRQLEPHHCFRSSSDGEVIAHGYAEWGLDVISRLNGDFSIVILDRKQNRLFLVRDRFGIKPLYIYQDSMRLLFCSEIKGILETGLARTGLRKEAISEYLAFQYALPPSTFFESIESVPPATVISIDLDTLEQDRKSYWSVPGYTESGGFEKACSRYRELFSDAVRLRLRSDVPLGSFLSGGLDSTLICLNTDDSVSHFFTAEFPGHESFSEAELASSVSRRLSGQHHLTPITDTDIASLMKDNIRAIEAPPSGCGTYIIHAICKQAREHVRVLLDGNGGDEILAGYPRYRLMRDGSGFSFSAETYADKLALLSPSLARHRSFLEQGFSRHPCEAYLRIIRLLYSEEERLFLRSSLEIDADSKFRRLFYSEDIEEQVKRFQITDISSYLVYLLEVQDKTAMAFSIENRVPFLDHRLAELCLSLPDSYRLGPEGQGKLLTRTAFRDIIPPELQSAPKAGTPRPDREWMMSGLISAMLKQRLTNKNDRLYQYLKYRAVNRVLRMHQSGRMNQSQRLWSFLNLSLFLEEFSAWI